MQNIDPEPSPAQVWTLQEAYRRFAATGRWPSFGELDRALDKQGIDLMEVSQGLSRQLSNLGSLRLSSRDDVILQPEALPYCRPDSQGDMDLILGIIWHATERYSSYDPAPGDPDEPRITGEELSRSLGFPESRLLRLYPLLIREDWTGSTSISEDGHFYLFVTREIRKYRGIQTYADYLRKRAETRNRVPDPVAGIRAATSLLNQRVAAVSVLNQGGGNDATQAPSQSSQAARTVSTTHVHDKPYRYEVALSFAGEDRVYVEQVAAILKNANVPLFYDRYEEANLWGKDLVAHLDNVYRKQSRFVVVFVSKRYAAKAWPRHEARSALARAIQQQGEFVLPARFDDTDLPGLQPSIGYVSCRTRTPDQVASLIIEKVNALASPDSTESSRATDTLSDRSQDGESQRDDHTIGPKEDHREPYVTARLIQATGGQPTSVVIRNLGEGPALDCVYVLLLTDPFGLKAWYMTVPTDLAAHESQQFALGPTHGIEQVSFTVSDDTTYSAGQRQRRYHDVFTRAFDNDPRAANVTWSSRALLGLQTPSEDLFQPTDGSSQAESSRDEALIFRCRNRHLHRTLPHVDSEPERVDPNDTTLAWIDWYRQIGRRGLPPPPETSTPKPERDSCDLSLYRHVADLPYSAEHGVCRTPA